MVSRGSRPTRSGSVWWRWSRRDFSAWHPDGARARHLVSGTRIDAGSTRILQRPAGSRDVTFFHDYFDDIGARIRDVDSHELERLSELFRAVRGRGGRGIRVGHGGRRAREGHGAVDLSE